MRLLSGYIRSQPFFLVIRYEEENPLINCPWKGNNIGIIILSSFYTNSRIEKALNIED